MHLEFDSSLSTLKQSTSVNPLLELVIEISLFYSNKLILQMHQAALTLVLSLQVISSLLEHNGWVHSSFESSFLLSTSRQFSWSIRFLMPVMVFSCDSLVMPPLIITWSWLKNIMICASRRYIFQKFMHIIWQKITGSTCTRSKICLYIIIQQGAV